MKALLGGILHISVKHTYLRGATIYFRRPVPKDLRDRVGRSVIKQNLHTSDPIEAAKAVARINRQLETEWAHLRGDPTASSAAAITQAVALLRSYGMEVSDLPVLKKSQDINELDFFEDAVDEQLYEVLRGMPEAEARQIDPVEVLDPVMAEAIKIVRNAGRSTVTSAMDFYFQCHQKGGNEAFQKLPRIAVAQFTEVVGDKPVEDVSRADVRRWMEWSVAKGQSHGTIQRRLATLKAIFSLFIREKELDIQNRFERQIIPAAAKKPEKREVFSAADLKAVQGHCKTADDDMRWAVAMLSDTCTRLAEIVGLRLSDIVLDASVPHVSIEEHVARSLKTPDSKRVIPLVGVALWAAKRVKETAARDQVYAFPRYIKDGQCQAESASGAINKWLRSKKMEHTTHEFRHTMADRLRDVGCPKELRDQIGGWARVDMAQSYGQGFALARMKEWLDKVVLPEVVPVEPVSQ